MPRHRDYTNPGGAVSEAMYDDHLEIIKHRRRTSITPEKLAQPHQPSPGTRSSRGVLPGRDH